ncbi:hypothetical protein B7760_05754 (plasmid) [Burkholderia glumae]|uniref:hypothetical protein n=1 Tax=Burkholderia glumae TaxID=337 RepID=UPI0013740E67|nr:hypothetical protein [Burkholderia glumae]QHP94801.1 hypothetical protein EXE55_28190 [Burkholderia glumae]QKM51677.1 hypothetical protein B7760_05754 [Burkholderia glumae]
MTTLSPNPFRPHRPRWVGPLLLSLPIYFTRLVMVGFVMPCALPLALIAALNLGSFTGITQTVLQMAAGTGTDATRIHFRTCADPVVRAGPNLPPTACTMYREEDLPIPVAAARAVPQLRAYYVMVIGIGLVLGMVLWHPTPLGLYWRGLISANEGDAK